MHHFVVPSSLVDSGSEKAAKLRLGGDELLPVCPKPRRIGSSTMPDFLQPLARDQSHSNREGSTEIMDMLTEKSHDVQEATCNGYSASCQCGSPPARSNNPLVRDIQFVHQMELLSPFSRTKLSNRFRI